MGKTKSKTKCQNLKIGEWKVKNVNNTETNELSREDTYNGETDITETEEEKYLGDIISKSGKNVRNIIARKNKSIGICRKIMKSLQDIWFGKYHYEVAILLRNSLLINSLLTNSEAWHNLTETDIRNLEKVDENLLCKILETPISTPREMLYLELGVMPIRFIIKSRRLNFLKYIVSEPNDSLVHQVFDAQIKHPTRNDWGQSVLKDLSDIDLNMNMLENMTKTNLRKHIKNKLEVMAFNYLTEKKLRHKKVKKLNHSGLKMAEYLEPNNYNIKLTDSKLLFQLKSKMVNVKVNYSSNHKENMNCPLCEKDGKIRNDTQKHIIKCPVIRKILTPQVKVKYTDLKSENVLDQLQIVKRFRMNYDIRKRLTNT